jgi:hypothetical protein
MVHKFKTALTRSGNIINPDHLLITEESVTWEKRNYYLIGKDRITIPMGKIVSVEIHNKGFGTDVKINSSGEAVIEAKDFTISDAKKIKNMIESYISKTGSNNRDSSDKKY